LRHTLTEYLAHDSVVAGLRPTAMAKAATPILIGPAWRLHHAVKRQMIDRDNSAHLEILSAETARYHLRRQRPF
jgi:hypothetical protein